MKQPRQNTYGIELVGNQEHPVGLQGSSILVQVEMQHGSVSPELTEGVRCFEKRGILIQFSAWSQRARWLHVVLMASLVFFGQPHRVLRADEASYSHSESSIHVNLSGDQLLLGPNSTAQLEIQPVHRQWDIYIHPNGEQEMRNLVETPVAYGSVTWEITAGAGSISGDTSTNGSGGASAMFSMGWGYDRVTVKVMVGNFQGSQQWGEAYGYFDPQPYTDPGGDGSGGDGSGGDGSGGDGSGGDGSGGDGSGGDGSASRTFLRSEANLQVTLDTSPAGQHEVQEGSSVGLVATVSYHTWDVEVDQFGVEHVANFQVLSASGAGVWWSVVSGDATIMMHNAGQVESNGQATASCVLNSAGTAVVQVSSSFHTGVGASATLTLSTKPPPPVGYSVGTFERVHIYQEGDTWNAPLQQGLSRALRVRLETETYERWIWGSTIHDVELSRRPTSGAWVEASVSSGNGTVESSQVSADYGGVATFVFHGGSLPSTLSILTRNSVGGVLGSEQFQMMVDPGAVWTQQGLVSWYEVELSRAPMPLQDGVVPTASARVFFNTATRYTNTLGEHYHVGQTRSIVGDGVNVRFEIVGDNAVFPIGGRSVVVATNAQGEALAAPIQTRKGGCLVSARVETPANSAVETPVAWIFLPEPVEVFTKESTQQTMLVDITASGGEFGVSPGTTRTLTAAVICRKWDLWRGSLGTLEHRNLQDSPAIGAQVEWIDLGAAGQLTLANGSTHTNANGEATASYTLNGNLGRVRASVTFNRPQSSGAVSVRANGEVTLHSHPSGTATFLGYGKDLLVHGNDAAASQHGYDLRYRTWEVWRVNGVTLNRNIQNGPAVDASVVWSASAMTRDRSVTDTTVYGPIESLGGTFLTNWAGKLELPVGNYDAGSARFEARFDGLTTGEKTFEIVPPPTLPPINPGEGGGESGGGENGESGGSNGPAYDPWTTDTDGGGVCDALEALAERDIRDPSDDHEPPPESVCL